ncbi:MAG: 2-dehydropantoate 2-reductase, partial [Fimbriimonadaceae bacterium]|nr:2-dehydropantoate 2-reductase [Alphaproteobacteria bacterium]
MKILVLGAGGVGGYFGGRLVEAGRDVTFLVRPQRAEKLEKSGLSIKSSLGDAQLAVKTVTTEAIDSTCDLIMLCCKSYHLDQAMGDIAPAVGEKTVILRLLNGLAHLHALDARFGADRVIGGSCYIAATIDRDGRIIHLNDLQKIALGERKGGLSERIRAIAAAFEPASFETMASDNIMQAMWQKFTLLS